MDNNENIDISNLDSLTSYLATRIYDNKLASDSTQEKDKTISYWTIGKSIKEHLMLHKNNLTYSRHVYVELSNRLKVSRRTLQLASQLYVFYPELNDIDFAITWTHFKILLRVGLPDKRKEFENLIIKKNLSSRELLAMVNEYNIARNAHGESSLKVIPGKPYVYKVKLEDGVPVLDQGFDLYRSGVDCELLNDREITTYEFFTDNKNFKIMLTEVEKSALYTYRARLIRVIDGDTVFVKIDVGFNEWIRQRLRLRGINAPHSATEKGLQATEFIITKLSKLDFFIIKTYHADRYGRYLTDIFYDPNNSDPNTIIQTGHFLNQELLDNGLATPYFKY